MERHEPGTDGVIVFRRVPVRRDPSQNAGVYLHLTGTSRALPSYSIAAFLQDEDVDVSTPSTHPAFAGSSATHNSPVPDSAAAAAPDGRPLARHQGGYDLVIDITEAWEARGAAEPRDGTVDVTFVLTDLLDRPLDVSAFVVDDIHITVT